ncbi:MAG TPA: hypothetical protein PKK99_01280 [Bacteroidia bacterium]|nr:hypothetical protein [Bacteroidia bacterium]
MKRTGLFIVVFFLLLIQESQGGWFFEHKYIGDMAFKDFVSQNHLEKFFSDTMHYRQYGVNMEVPFVKNCCVIDYYQGMYAIMDSVKGYSYGDLCGLAADHSVDFAQLYQNLIQGSALFQHLSPDGLFGKIGKDVQEALNSHYRGIENHKNQGDYFSLTYVLLAGEDKSHFQVPPQSLKEMLRMINPELIKVVDEYKSTDASRDCSPAVLQLRKEFDKKILELNNVSKYALLHILAQDAMKNAAKFSAKDSISLSAKYITIAFLLNGFGDHFIQDAFAGGHLPVKRNSSGLDNNGIHDFYCRVGIEVENERNEKWKTYGDNFYDKTTFDHARAANLESLNNLWSVFLRERETYKKINEEKKQGLVQTSSSVILYQQLVNNRIPENLWQDSLVKACPAFAFIPKPLNPQQYDTLIALKHGSKNGKYFESGFGYGINRNSNARNDRAHAAIGLGFCLLKPQPGTDFEAGDFSKKIESILWLGVSLRYTYVDAMNYNEQSGLFGLHCTIKDRLAINQEQGIAFYNNTNAFTAETSIGWELKYLSCRFAPSFNYFLSYGNHELPIHGIRLTLRYY